MVRCLYVLYDLALICLVPLGILLSLFDRRMAAKPASFWWRLGFGRPEGGGLRGTPRIWIHAASFGEVALLPRLAEVAYCGGSLVPLGGQNPLEPAVWGKVVQFDPGGSDSGLPAIAILGLSEDMAT